MRATVVLSSEIDTEELAEQLCSAPVDDLIEFIRLLDKYVADLEFTKRLAKLFAAEVRKEGETP